MQRQIFLQKKHQLVLSLIIHGKQPHDFTLKDMHAEPIETGYPVHNACDTIHPQYFLFHPVTFTLRVVRGKVISTSVPTPGVL